MAMREFLAYNPLQPPHSGGCLRFCDSLPPPATTGGGCGCVFIVCEVVCVIFGWEPPPPPLEIVASAARRHELQPITTAKVAMGGA